MLEVYEDYEALSREVAARIATVGNERGQRSIILSGGSTPRRLFELLADEWRERLSWSQLHLFWSDERFVSATDEASNYGLAARLFIDHVDIPSRNVHRVPTHVASAEEAAHAYDEEIQAYFANRSAEAFDLAILGIGGDGHTASLFPGGDPPADQRWAAAVTGPADRPPRERVTLTYHALQAARTVLFVASGEAKRNIVRRLVENRASGLPVGRVRGSDATAVLVDQSAAP